MMEGWKRVKIGDLGEVITGNTPPKKDPANYGGDYPFIKPTDMEIDRRYITNWEENYSEKAFKRYKNSYIPPKATGVVTIGTVGEKIFQADRYCFTNQSVNVVIPNENYDEDFVYYVLKINLPKVLNANPGTASGRHHVSKSNFCAIKIDVPKSKETQRKIASILSAYDDLIENNLKRIKLLEAQAQLTYEEWFSVSGTPKGWNEYVIGDLIEFHIGGGWGQEVKEEGYPVPAFVIRGTDMDNLPLGSIGNVPFRWHKKSNLKSRKLQDGDIVFEVSGGSSNEGVAKTTLITEGLLKQFDSDVMCASFCKLMRPKTRDYSYALIMFLKYLRKTKGTEIFEKRSASNIVNYNWEAFLKYQKIKMPNNELLKEFNQLIEPQINSIYILGNQITKLKEARDILLPRLMSGMIDLEKLEVGSLKYKVNDSLGKVAEGR
ncbi:restriction endonuclease subunit S [Winogradskyella sp. HB-48]|uniref:restriction endonuclease subunit S n=1 Tax=Winogradskyella sp. HB-48 TaxID=3416808 RepID=UPI003CF0534D